MNCFQLNFVFFSVILLLKSNRIGGFQSNLAIVCEVGQVCMLKSYFRLINKKTSKITVWTKSQQNKFETGINFSNNCKQKNTLIILNVQKTDESFYFEVHNSTLLMTYHLTVIDRLNRLPVYAGSNSSYLGFDKNNKSSEYEIVWDKWSSCVKTNSSLQGYRKRVGDCYLNKLYLSFKTSCYSNLLGFSNSTKSISYISYEDCHCNDCIYKIFSDTNHSTNAQLKLQIVKEANYVILDCQIEQTVSNYNHFAQLDVKWSFKDQSITKGVLKEDRFLVDNNYKLNIAPVSSSDSGNYYCYQNQRLIRIITLEVSSMKVFNTIHKHVVFIGYFLMFIALIATSLFVCLKDKTSSLLIK